jgi:cytochrome c553
VIGSLLSAGLAWSLVSAEASAGDAEAGKKKFYTCQGCHGVVGYTNAFPTYHVPRLGGQHADYIVAALEAYQSGERKHPSMQGNAAALSEDDMEDIAMFVSKFRGLNQALPTHGNIAEGKEKAQVCASCHGSDGNGDNSSVPRLAGQYEDYIVQALKDYKSGARKNPVMSGFAAGLSEEDREDIAAYYASQKKGLTIPQD